MWATGAGPFRPPQNPADPGHGPLIMGLTWTFASLSILAVTVRFYVKVVHSRLRLWWDDWTLLLALLFQMVAQACVTHAYTWGLGQHDRDLTVVPQLIHIQKWVYIGVIPNLLASSVARISAALLLIRLFGRRKWFKWYLIVFTSVQTILILADAAVLWTQSEPIEGLWNPFVKAVRRPPSVSESLVYTIQAMLTFSDLTYVLFPIIFVYKLHMPFQRKLGLILLLMLSLVTMTVSLLKTIQAKISVGDGRNTDDMQYRTSLLQVWAGVEQSLVITLSCVPTLRTWFNNTVLPAFQGMTSSVVRVFASYSRSRSIPKGSKGGNDKSNSVQYYDLECQPQMHQHHVSVEGTGYHQSLVPGSQIRQTNNITISTVPIMPEPPPNARLAR
ncbi:hypothetical protein PG997_013960 [Apiospora hydei]|uniref:Rhodopsin domain-containing protein n=1 Tax=Apiospora hydei TaxID=1337664 RepID=A0ABR1V7P6_9PEZI